MEDDLNKKWKTNQSTKINLIGCDTIVNSPSYYSYRYTERVKRHGRMLSATPLPAQGCVSLL